MSIDIQIGNITHKGDVKSAVIISRPNPLVLMSTDLQEIKKGK